MKIVPSYLSRPSFLLKTFKTFAFALLIFFGILYIRNWRHNPIDDIEFYETTVVKVEKVFVPSVGRQFYNNLVANRPDLYEIEQDQLLPHILIGNVTHSKLILIVPVVERTQQSYVVETLTSLTNWMDEEDRKEAKIMIFISGTNDFVKKTAKAITQKFNNEIEAGVIQINRIPNGIYPSDWNIVPDSFGDTRERIIWRSKQGIDFMYILMYSSHFGDYVLQLEDDILAARGFIKNILTFVEMRSDWDYVHFSFLGFIGKLFKSEDALALSRAIGLFWKHKPVDWILSDYARSKHCSLDWNHTRCAGEIARYAPNYLPSQFQHMGKHSSLKGKIQKLRERTFMGTKEPKQNKGNPEANLNTSMSITKSTLSDWYIRGAFLWVSNPKKNDEMRINFYHSTQIKGFVISSGSQAEPGNHLGSDAVVKALLKNGTVEDLGQFDKNGRLFGRLECKDVDALGVLVGADISHPVVFDQITIYRC